MCLNLKKEDSRETNKESIKINWVRESLIGTKVNKFEVNK